VPPDSCWYSVDSRRRARAALVGFAILAMACDSGAADVLFPVMMTYRLPAQSGYQFEFSGNTSRLMPFGDEAENVRRADGSLMEPTSPHTFHPCSSPTAACVVSDRYVFAVPRGKLSAGMRIGIAGAEAKVIGCIPESDASCAVAVLDSRCMVRNPSNAENSSNPTRCSYASNRSRLVYIFDSHRGIIAFDDASGWPEALDVSRWSLDTIGTSAAMYALVEAKGLLASGGF